MQEINLDTYTLSPEGKIVKLNPKEMEIDRYFVLPDGERIRNAATALRTVIIEQVTSHKERYAIKGDQQLQLSANMLTSVYASVLVDVLIRLPSDMREQILKKAFDETKQVVVSYVEKRLHDQNSTGPIRGDSSGQQSS